MSSEIQSGSILSDNFTTGTSGDLMAMIANMDISKLDLNKIPRSELIKLQRLLTPKMTKYIPHVPTPKQAAFLLLDNKEAFYGGAAGGGKALSLDTPILTDSGWKTIGNLHQTDKVLALDGSWSEIEYVTDVQVQHDCYEIVFSNGEVIIADAEHLWGVTEFKYRKYWKNNICTTKELKEGMKLIQASSFKGTIQELPVVPYVLGYWLGDGNSHTGSVTIGDEDFDEVQKFLPPLNKHVSMPQQYTVKGLTTQLNKLGLLRPKNENRETYPEVKHIPIQYILSSFEQRLELLRGIMDSDGHCQKRGRCELSLVEKRLFDDVCTLLSSLGIVYSATETVNAYRITFSTNLQVFKLSRKMQRQCKALQNKIFVLSVNYIGKRDVKCIRIKHPSHMFLCGKRLIPTHNSDALLMGGLQYVDVKGYAGIIFRKTYADLTKPAALIDRSKEWLTKWDDTKWNEKEKKWEFYKKYGPHKELWSILQFGYMETDNDRYNYQGGEYQFVGWDELTHISLVCYQYMFSRLRRLKGVKVPLRVRSGSNPPDDDQGLWVYKRFVDPKTRRPNTVFIPAGMNDNPYLDQEAYNESLEELDPVTRERLKKGVWDLKRKGNMFKREWLEAVDVLPANRRIVRFWDMAATDVEKAKKKNRSAEPDYTCGFKLSESNGIYYIEDIIRVRKSPAITEAIQKYTARADGPRVIIREEQEPGSSGLTAIDMKARQIFKGYNYAGVRSTGNKVTRASGFSAAMERGQVKYIRGCRNIEAFMDEMESFPGGLHDDMVDGGSGAFSEMTILPENSAPIGVESEYGSTWLDEENFYEGLGLGAGMGNF